MNIKDAINQAQGQAIVARALNAHGYTNITRSTVHGWKERNQLPRSEWSGKTQYAAVICNLLHAFAIDVAPKDLCPGAKQYEQPF